VIKTLILKAETTGDVHKLRIDNRSLKDEIERLKVEEIHRKREMDEMKSIVGNLKKQIEDLKDQLDFAEEDRRKARESQRIAEWKAKKRSDNEILRSDYDVSSGNIPNIEEDVRSTGERKLSKENPMDGQEPPEKNSILKSIKDATTEVSMDDVSTDIENRNNKQIQLNEELVEINMQIKKLAKKKAEIKKLGIIRDKDGNKNKVEMSQDIYPPPLPQRTPKIKPKVLSNIQLVPPSSDNTATAIIPKNLTEKVVSREMA